MDAQTIFQGLMKRGLDAPHAAILAGNVEQESGFNPLAWNKKEKAGGIIQWRKDRLQNLMKFAKDSGRKPGDTDTQLDFLVHEMTKGSESKAGKAFLAASDPESMNKALHGYIRYGDNTEKTRLENSRKFITITPAGDSAAPAPAAQAPADLSAPGAQAGSLYEMPLPDAQAAPQAPAAAAVAQPDLTQAQPVPEPTAAAGEISLDDLMSHAGVKDESAGAAPAGGEITLDQLMKHAGAGETVAKAPAAAGILPAMAMNSYGQRVPLDSVEIPAPVPQIADKTDLGGADPWHGMGNPYSSIFHGATLSASDEILAGATAPIDAAINKLTGKGPTSLSENYQQNKAREDRDQAAYERDHPILATAGEIGGSLLVPASAAAKGVQAIKAAPTLLAKGVELGKNMLTGGALGTIYGFNSGNGVDDRIEKAKEGAATGTVAGAVAPAVVKAGVGTIKYAKNLFRVLDPFLGGFGEKRIAQRIVKEGLGDMPPMANAGEIIPGSTPTLAEASGSANAALLQRQVRDANPELFVARETAQNDARANFLATLQGNGQDLAGAKKVLSDHIEDTLAKTFTPGAKADATPFVAAIDKILAGPGGQRSAVENTLNAIKSKVVDAKGALKIDDVETLYKSVRREIGDMLDKTAHNAKPEWQAASKELMAVRKALDDVIESGAPGFKKYLAEAEKAYQPINAMQYLQGLKMFPLPGDKITLGQVNSALKKIFADRKAPGTNDAKSLTKDQIGKLVDLRKDLLRERNVGAGKSLGSPTSQNLTATEMMNNLLPFGGKLASKANPRAVGAAVGFGLGHLISGGTGLGSGAGAVIGERAGQALSAIMRGKDSRVMQEVQNLLLNPSRITAKGRKNFPVDKFSRLAIPAATVGTNRLLSAQ